MNGVERKVALVHDWLNQIGGAENVLETLVDMFPGAPVFTSMYGPDLMSSAYRHWHIHTSFMQSLPFVTRYHQLYLPLYPLAFEGFDFSNYDLVLSNKSGFCHGIITPPEVLHICYCLTPTRFLWSYPAYRQREGLGRFADLLLRPWLAYLRMWDRAAADRVDHFIAISRVVQRRIAKVYRRASVVIHPPVNTEQFVPGNDPPEDYFLVVSRLIPYKRLDLAVAACTRLNLPLVVVGDGRDRAALEKEAGPTVRFLGRVSHKELVQLFQRCRAFVWPGLEDFGIAPVEAQAAGRPVIAYAGGGALDTVIAGVTGAFFYDQSVDALADVLSHFKHCDYDRDACRQQAERFSVAEFRRNLSTFIAERLAEAPI